MVVVAWLNRPPPLPEAVLFEITQLETVYVLRSEEHTSELQSRLHLVCRLLLEKKKHIDPRPAPRRANSPPPAAPTRNVTPPPTSCMRTAATALSVPMTSKPHVLSTSS